MCLLRHSGSDLMTAEATQTFLSATVSAEIYGHNLKPQPPTHSLAMLTRTGDAHGQRSGHIEMRISERLLSIMLRGIHNHWFYV